MKKGIKILFSILLIIIMTSVILVSLYIGWLSPSNNYETYNAFPRLNFDFPLGFYQPSSTSEYNYVIEMGGKIKIFENSRWTGESSTLLDLSSRVHVGSEDGLLGLAFHPNFSDNGKFYTYHSEHHSIRYGLDCDVCISSLLSEFKVDPKDPTQILPNSERTLIEINQTNAFHRGGQLMFDSDGYLIAQIGDGVQDLMVQNLTSFYGKVIRIDVDTRENGKEYGIPTDNPFYSRVNVSKEIYAYGLRNPWRGSIDPVTDELWVGDVGKDYFEEINLIKPGKNYGWPVYEGYGCRDNKPSCFMENATFPFFAYPHPTDDQPISKVSEDPVGVAVIGGHVYRGSEMEGLYGDYIFADYSGSIFKLEKSKTNKFEGVEYLHRVTDWISQIGVDNNNELYICSIYLGNVLKLRESTHFWFIFVILIYLSTWYLLLRKSFPKLFIELN